MTFDMREVAKSKLALRRRLATSPIAEKLRLLDELRERTLTIIASRKRQLPSPPVERADWIAAFQRRVGGEK